MAAPIGPTVRRMQLGHELQQLRRQAGFTNLKEVVDGLGFSDAQLRRVENGESAFRKQSDLVAALERYGVTDQDDVAHFTELHRQSLNRGWWSTYSRTMSSGMKIYVGLEDGATNMRAWQPSVIFGLLQTENYARELFRTHKPIDELTTEQVERGVELRMERREILTRENPVTARFILDEAALRHVVGGSEVMREQYRELIKMSELDNVSLHVLPLSKPAYRCAFDFTVLDFGAGLPTAVQMDLIDGGVNITDKTTEVWAFSRRFDALRDGALPPEETPKFLEQLAREI
ncbi:helix-turn-helix domain-containing protein [Streptomyces sp. QH1-20]|uniref:helix-turn-helix domain-containing protein n=1 Tax=Streptomyces sp. QH1-20 TaxID=3240934 RepID=UPI0035122469